MAPSPPPRTRLADEFLHALAAGFEPARDGARAAAMSAYMRDRFAFLGIQKPERVRITRAAAAGLGPPTDADLAAVALGAWAHDEREYQYAAVWYLRRHVDGRRPGFLKIVRRLIITKSWWDTVDDLAVNIVGPLVRAHPGLRATLDRWIDGDDLWLARAAILHQLKYGDATDPAVLFGYCLRRADDPDFFARKAIGWALRQYARTDPDAVAGFVAGHDAELSPLSKREALKHLGGRPG